MHPETGWGGRDRTYECRNQNPVPYHLATPHLYGRFMNRPHVNQAPNHATDALLNLARLHRASRAAAAATLLQPGCGWQTRQTRMRQTRSSSLSRSYPAKLYNARLPGRAHTPQIADRCEVAVRMAAPTRWGGAPRCGRSGLATAPASG